MGALLAYARDRARGRIGALPPLLGALASWLHPWQGETLILILLACELVTAGKGARFGRPEVRRGLAARGGGVFRLPRRLPHALAMELLVTGAPLDAARAEHFGWPAAVAGFLAVHRACSQQETPA